MAEVPTVGMVRLFGSHACGVHVVNVRAGCRGAYDLAMLVDCSEVAEDATI